MARYDYVCRDCGHAQEVSHLIAECDTHVEVCSNCGQRMDRAFSVAGVTVGGFPLHQSLNPNVERFWETGDPVGMSKSDPNYIH